MSVDDYPGDSSTRATLEAGGRIWGNTETPGDVDWFHITFNPDHAYRFTAWTADGTEPLISIFDATDMWVDYTNRPGGLVSNELGNPYAFAQPGHEYYLQVSNPTAAAYTIGMEIAADDVGNSVASARAVTVGGTAGANFDYMFDTEYYRLAVTAGVTYTITLAADGLPDDAWLRLSGIDLKGDAGSIAYTATESGTFDISAELIGYYPFPKPIHYTLSLTERDTGAPGIVSASGAIEGEIKIVFNEAVKLGSGTISVRDIVLEVGSKAVSVNGNTVTLDVGHNLGPGVYDVRFGASAVTDLLGNHGAYVTEQAVRVEQSLHGHVVTAVAGNGSGSHIHGTTATNDIAIYQGNASDYAVTAVDEGFRVQYRTGSSDVLTDVERLYFTEGDDVIALSLAGNLGQVYRLYEAAFNRTPDKGGLGYWTGHSDEGMSLRDIAHHFVDSPEFAIRYGAYTSNAEFVDVLYQNILDRAGEPAGVAWWNARLDEGADRADVLTGFSDSVENQQGTATIGNGFSYTPYG